MSPLISVILPIYNMEDYLARCLDSILGNTYQNLEILCVDDGSKDRSLEILRQYAAKDSRIVVIAKENGGVSSARNAGLDRMIGEYVTFIDPDDFVHPQFFELLLKAQKDKKADLAVCGFDVIDDSAPSPEAMQKRIDASAADSINCIRFFQNRNHRAYCWGRLINLRSVNLPRFHEEIRYAEDAVFNGELWEQNPELSCCVIDQKLYYYVQREGSAIKRAGERDRLIVAKIFAEKAGESPRNEEIYLEQTLRRLLNSRYYASHIFPDREAVRSCREALRTCMPVLRRTNHLSRKEKLRYIIFVRIPFSYWLFRVLKDPGMWKWEKMERKKRLAAKKAGEPASE